MRVAYAVKALRPLAGAALALVLAACATPGPAPVPAERPIAAAFDTAGRLSARRGNDGVAVHFTWQHASGSDVFDVATPLGQTVARLRGDAAGIFVERPGEAPLQYPNWNALTETVIGVGLPVDGLVSWLQAAPAPASASDVERDGAGRPLVLRQQGWEIVYAYPDDAPGARPARLIMRYPAGETIEVRIVVDRFAASAP